MISHTIDPGYPEGDCRSSLGRPGEEQSFVVREKPLITFALASFNQARFIRQAVEGALAQTYSPLEIILSDDCSQDETFKITEQVAAEYRGVHRVVLNRNPVQRSIGGHLNRLMELARGELIVLAAGDDISLPQRVQKVYEVWEQSARQATSIHSNFLQIDEQGTPIEQVFEGCHAGDGQAVEQRIDPLAYVRTLEPIVFGCAHAFSRRLYDVFGPVLDAVIHEDNTLAFRSILAGRVYYLDEALVKYRVHAQNINVGPRQAAPDLTSLKREEERVRRRYRNRQVMYEGFLQDLGKASARGLINPDQAKAIAREAEQRGQRLRLMGEFLESGLWDKRRILRRLRREGLDQAECSVLARRLVPQPLLLRLRLVRRYAAMALGLKPPS